MRTGIALLLLAAAAVCFAQTHESVTVHVIDVPVYVSLKNEPVRNLSRDDFELFVNGKRQPIDYFDTIDLAAAQRAAPTAPSVRPDPRERRLFLLMFDLAFTEPGALNRARKAARAMIDRAGPADYFAVATYTAPRGVQLLIPFTNDHATAARAAFSLHASGSADPLALAISSSEHAAFAEPLDVKIDSGIDKRADDDGFMDQQTMAIVGATDAHFANLAMPEKRLIENQFDGLRMLASRMEKLEGYKHVVVFSKGFRPELVYAKTEDTDPHLIDSMAAMVRAFRAAGAVIDTIDLGGDRTLGANDGLAYYAHETGGLFIQHENDPKAALTRISDISAAGYRLGFTLPEKTKKGENTISVRVHNLPRGATVAFRRGFSTTSSRTLPFDGLRLADILQNDVPQTGIATKVTHTNDGKLRVEIPVTELLTEYASGVNAAMLFYVFDANHTVVHYDAKRVSIATRAKSNVTIEEPLSLPPGRYVCKVLLQAGEALGFTRHEFEIAPQSAP
jgi:VWFA-related protein